jgi:hypothetical protein
VGCAEELPGAAKPDVQALLCCVGVEAPVQDSGKACVGRLAAGRNRCRRAGDEYGELVAAESLGSGGEARRPSGFLDGAALSDVPVLVAPARDAVQSIPGDLAEGGGQFDADRL